MLCMEKLFPIVNHAESSVDKDRGAQFATKGWQEGGIETSNDQAFTETVAELPQHAVGCQWRNPEAPYTIEYLVDCEVVRGREKPI